ncbi:MAG: GW dipeptide domain-containing protein [Bacteroidales bacterium]|nr:GW dipeptide domain-containing protein [Bacteroidales bacterium]MCF8402571.1 GW dipeptide domain-containing protein [Bacteroidales bacterium]
MRNLKLIAMLLLFAGLIVSCSNNQDAQESEKLYAGNHKVEVKEVIQATAYTYLLVTEKGEEYWMAISKMEVGEGAVLYYRDRMEMKNFPSKELDKTFDKIYFIQEVSDNPILPPGQTFMGKTEPEKPSIEKIEVNIDLPDGVTSIDDLFTNKESFDNKSVTVMGKVTKVNASIMERNWIHIQDGTGGDTNYDLTITTDDLPQVGEIVTYTGVVGLKKDFGSGYYYELLLEQGERVNNEI